MNKHNFLIVLQLLAVLGSTAIVLSIASLPITLADNREGLAAIAPPAQDDEPSDFPDEGIEVEAITVTETGFDPIVVTRQSGPFIIAMHNMSGEKELVFRIHRAQGQQLHQLRLPAGRRANHIRLDPPIGDYVISETNHPSWSCALTITR